MVMERKGTLPYKYTIIGGDLRNVKLADFLRQDGNEVILYGFEKADMDVDIDVNIKKGSNLTDAIDDSDVVIGPIPCSLDHETVNAPYSSEKILISDVFKKMSKNQIFIAGLISERIRNLAEVYNVYAVDLYEREDMAILNAIPTAEGAIQIAMEETPYTIHSSTCMVLGFGRIGKILAKMLHGIGANVMVMARKYSDIALIDSYGYIPIHIADLPRRISEADIIFNTVPSIILTEEMLSRTKRNVLIIDLASKPGGVGFAPEKIH